MANVERKSSDHLLPDFLIGGAAKSGSTSLWRYMKRHPKIFMKKKEPNFWAFNYERGLDWYRSIFEDSNEDQLIGEASVSTLANAERTAPRIAEDLPDVKLIFILRDPIERAYSEFWHHVRGERLKHEKPTPILFEKIITGEKHIPAWMHEGMSIGDEIVMKGMYFDQLKKFYSRIEENQIKVIIFEDFKYNEDKITQDMFSFLGLNKVDVDTSRVHMKGRYPFSPNIRKMSHDIWYTIRPIMPSFILVLTEKLRNRYIYKMIYSKQEKPEMTEGARNYLQDTYEEQVRGVEELTGYDLDHWL